MLRTYSLYLCNETIFILKQISLNFNVINFEKGVILKIYHIKVTKRKFEA
jgi:hypothetical protein